MTSPEPLFLVVDQGSTSTKGAVRTLAGETLREASIPCQSQTIDGQVRLDPQELATQIKNLVSSLRDGLPPAELVAMGLTCQRSTCLIWERPTGAPVSHALSWQDTSQQKRIEELDEHSVVVAQRTGLRLSPHYAATKLHALLHEVPDGHDRAASGELVAGTLDAFLVKQLVGVDATEGGHAGRTLLYNLEHDEWDAELGRLFQVPQEALPALRPSAGSWGTHNELPLTAVAGDQQAALIGHGGWRSGVTAVHFGTGAFVLASTGERVVRHPQLLSAVLADTEHTRQHQIEGSVNSAGSAVDWILRHTDASLESWSANTLDPDALPWVFPAFAGAASPYWDASARSVIRGVELATDGDALLGGVLFGLAMRVLDAVETLAEAGVTTDVLRVSGKLTRLQSLVAMLADAGQMVVEISAEEETGLAGITQLAAAGHQGNDEPLLTTPAARHRCEPQWSPDRAAQVRAEWKEFAAKALRL